MPTDVLELIQTPNGTILDNVEVFPSQIANEPDIPCGA
jgi:hypothetical protein